MINFKKNYGMRYFKNIFFIGLLFIFYFSSLAQSNNQFIIASGSKGGNYVKAGAFIATEYNKNTHSNFNSIETNGSLENINLLKNSFADFAIVQRNVLLNSLYDETNGINSIEVIAPLFEEKLLIYTHSKKSISERGCQYGRSYSSS